MFTSFGVSNSQIRHPTPEAVLLPNPKHEMTAFRRSDECCTNVTFKDKQKKSQTQATEYFLKYFPTFPIKRKNNALDRCAL